MMEHTDTVDAKRSTDTQQPDELTTETTNQTETGATDSEDLTTDEAVVVNGGEPDITIDGADAEPVIQEAVVDSSTREIAELKDKYLRLYADFENYRRRTAKEKLELIGNANESLLQTLIPVVDDFERAMQSIEKTDDVTALKEGVSLIYTKLYKTLEAKGLKPMVSKGEPFNADLHESVTQFPAPSDDLKGKVIDEIEKGYYLNDKVIRFAKVIVGS